MITNSCNLLLGVIMGSNGLPRSGVVQPFEGYPAHGAVHEVIPNERLRSFALAFANIADSVFKRVEWLDLNMVTAEVPLTDEEPFKFDPEDQEFIDEVYDPRKYYKMFNIDDLGVSVLEMDPSERAARNLRTLFERQDFGAVEKEARNEIDRLDPNLSPQLIFDRVNGVGHRVPNVPRTEIRQKLALMPDGSKGLETVEMIGREADIIVSHIRRRLKQFVYPWDITPHLTFVAFKKKAQVINIERIIKETNEHLEDNPVSVRLDRKVEFRHKSSRSKH